MTGLVVKEHFVVIRQFLTTQRVEWPRIERFELRRTVYRPSLQIVMRNGRTYGVVGLAARSPAERDCAEAIFGELRETLRQRRQAGAGGEAKTGGTGSGLLWNSS